MITNSLPKPKLSVLKTINLSFFVGCCFATNFTSAQAIIGGEFYYAQNGAIITFNVITYSL